MYRRGRETTYHTFLCEYLARVNTHYFISVVLNFQTPRLTIFHCTQTHISKPKVHDFLIYELNFLYIGMLFTILKKETYWLVNPEYVSIVWQRFIRTKVSNWLGLHPGALFPFKHAEISSGEWVQNSSLGKERVVLVIYPFIHPDHKPPPKNNEYPMYVHSYVNYTSVPLYCI